MISPTWGASTSGSASTSTLMLVPNGGDIFSQSAGATRLRQAPDLDVTFDRSYFLAADGPFIAIASGATGSSLDWAISTGLQGSASVWVKVTAIDADGTVVGSDISAEPFAID